MNSPVNRSPMTPPQAMQHAYAAYTSGDWTRAEQVCRSILNAHADYLDALNLLGVIAAQSKRFEDATILLERVVNADPGNAVARNNLGNLHYDLRQYDKALQSFEDALAIKPDYAEAHYNRGVILQELNRFDDALASLDRALECAPGYLEALINRSSVLQELKRFDDALQSCDRALQLKPDSAEAYTNRGAVLQKLKRPVEALDNCNRALQIDSDHAEALITRSAILRDLKRFDSALDSCDHALKIRPGHTIALINRGTILRDLGRPGDALHCFEQVLKIEPDHTDALLNRGRLLGKLRRHEEAVRSYAKLLERIPDYPFARGEYLHQKMLCCDWDQFDFLAGAIDEDLRAGKKSAEPFGYLAIAGSPQQMRRCVEIYLADALPAPPPLWTGERYCNEKIRVGYLSGEFGEQATSVLMTELFELHDKQRFEIFAIDSGRDDGSARRRRIIDAVDEIVDISRLSDPDAAADIKRRRIDLLINLNGYFGNERQGVFSHRPCPVQVNYLGFPGTIGADYIDYIIADRKVIPPDHRDHYAEKVVYLPDSYQVNDRNRRISERISTRAEANLPGTGFVFCCFNNNYKITPGIFSIWMRLLQTIPGSVLWLLEDNPAAAGNLRREAIRHGNAPERLVFAPRMNLDLHLARHRLADLFLDTLPCNAHTTASDALWAGLPLLTCEGSTFAGRVAASVLDAIGLPELIASSLPEYEEKALQLATNPAMLAGIRSRLARNRTTHALFDTARYCRNIESAYFKMWQRYQRGEAPDTFAV